MREPGFETLCQHAGENPRRYHGAVAPPLFQNSLFTSPDCETFIHRGKHHPDIYDYTRGANPTTDVLQMKLAALERTEAARCFGSGDAAVAAAIMHCVSSGDHVVAVDTVYGPTRVILNSYLTRFGVTATFVRGTEVQEFADAILPNTKLIYLESPSSVVFWLQDIAAVTALAHERGIVTAIDNSWATPYFQNPVELGVDIVVHSATKYLGGHSDIVAGVATGRREHLDALSSREGGLMGGILDPFASWLMIRGLRTLPLRMERHQSSAMAVARFLEAHPKIACVHYPGLPSHPQHELAKKQMRGFSGLLSFELKEGGRESACRMIDTLRYFGIGVSWGGFESLAIPIGFPPDESKGTFYMPGVTRPERREGRWGARLSIGLETLDDLMEDLETGLEAV